MEWEVTKLSCFLLPRVWHIQVEPRPSVFRGAGVLKVIADAVKLFIVTGAHRDQHTHLIPQKGRSCKLI